MIGGAHLQVLDPERVLRCFRAGQVVGPKGPLAAERSLLTPKSLLVFTTGGGVLKLRRPRSCGPNNWTTRGRRAFAAKQELFFGRQLSPSVYLGDCALTFTDVEMRLIPGLLTGEPIVALRRLPEERRADRVLTEDGDIDAIGGVVARIADYQSRARFERAGDAITGPNRVAARWRRTLARLDEASAQDGPEHALLTADARRGLDDAMHEALRAHKTRLAHRVLERRIRYLHGDLRLEHLYLTRVPGIIDPREEGEDAHWMDAAEDITLPAMELDALGLRGLGAEFLNRYAGFAEDRTLATVAPLFKRLHAVRRAAELIEECAGLPADTKKDAHLRARHFLALALSY